MNRLQLFAILTALLVLPSACSPSSAPRTDADAGTEPETMVDASPGPARDDAGTRDAGAVVTPDASAPRPDEITLPGGETITFAVDDEGVVTLTPVPASLLVAVFRERSRYPDAERIDGDDGDLAGGCGTAVYSYDRYRESPAGSAGGSWSIWRRQLDLEAGLYELELGWDEAAANAVLSEIARRPEVNVETLSLPLPEIDGLELAYTADAIARDFDVDAPRAITVGRSTLTNRDVCDVLAGRALVTVDDAPLSATLLAQIEL